MFQLYRRIKWLYQKFKVLNLIYILSVDGFVSVWLPFLALVSYTILGAFIFKSLEMDRDQNQREHYRNRTAFALDQVLDRMLEVRCHDMLVKADKTLQVHHAKEALFWFLDHLNLTEVIEERTDDTPWTWLGSMFYAGQLYTTIGYGYPTTRTTGGRVASIFYILIGIPILLIILKDMSRLLSRALRKLYKRLRTSKQRIVGTTPIKKLSIHTMSLYKSEKSDTGKKVHSKEKTIKDAINGKNDPELGPEQQNKMNQRIQAENAFPIPIALCILFLWIIFSASLFCIWEKEWGFMTSVYFFFVSISTVGLGDIVFSNPDMMIYNFGLILIGLALLSMCFNLIQASLECLLDRLLEEYIEEIEKMAEIVANEEYLEEEAIPLEFKMTGNLLTLPMKRVTHDTSFLAEAKGWMAGRIANNLLASRLGGGMESESESEEEEPASGKVEGATAAVHPPMDRQPSKNSAASDGSRRSSRHLNLQNRYQFRHNKPLFNTIKTLEKIKPTQHGDFRAMVFSKFIQSDRLTRLVVETAVPQKKMATTGCQTEPEEEQKSVRMRKAWRHRRNDSNSSFSTVYTNSAVMDDESIMSVAYCDLKFDYSTEVSSPSSNMRSTLSILKVDDDEPSLPSKLSQFWNILPTSPVKNNQLFVQANLAAVHELPSPLASLNKETTPLRKEKGERTIEAENGHAHSQPAPIRRCPSASDVYYDSPSIRELDSYDRIRSICGLLPHDFDDRSNSSRSTMVDSGYDRSHNDDVKKTMTCSLAESIMEESSDSEDGEMV